MDEGTVKEPRHAVHIPTDAKCILQSGNQTLQSNLPRTANKYFRDFLLASRFFYPISMREIYLKSYSSSNVN